MDLGLLSLFFGSFLASTILPGGVEGLLYYQVNHGHIGFWPLFIVATVGNTLGGWTTWWVGALLRKGLRGTRIESWFSLSPKAISRVKRYGPSTLLFSWLPIIGDPLCVAAGYLSLRFWTCALAIFIGKALRYLVLLWFLYQ
ncbi:MAG: VTT domain-containing protein [Acidiferrobacterales bacterium]|nr:VTT domain-containing protein [Acidiferrobacterales bacterium]